MGLFYTGKGDKGESIVGKKKIDKTSIEIEALGDLDELNSFLGIVRSSVSDRGFKKIILDVQEDLFIIQAHVAGFILARRSFSEGWMPQFKPPVFKKEKIKKLEKIIDGFEKKIKPAKKFVLPGATKEAAVLDYARALARRAERSAIKAVRQKPHAISKKHIAYSIQHMAVLAYLNRLSSLFFAMARMSVKMSNKKEKNPHYK